MNPLESAKRTYESTKMPGSLEELVENSIQTARAARVQKRKARFGWGVSAAAGLLIGFTFLVNVNTAFAAGLKEIPLLGALVRLVTIQSYREQTEDFGITVNVPSLEQIGSQQASFPAEVNRMISDMCREYVEDAKQRALEYKEAYLETGGTPEGWKEHNIQITVGYEIKSQSDSCISFAVSGTENWTSAYAQTRYYNISLKEMRFLTLEDVFGGSYISLINDAVRGQIKERQKNGNDIFFTFQSVLPDQQFYINEEGCPVIVFGKYEIAPGSMGTVEFEIPIK